MGPAAHHVWEQAVAQDHGQVEHSTQRPHALCQLEEVAGLLRDAHVQAGYNHLSTQHTIPDVAQACGQAALTYLCW